MELIRNLTQATCGWFWNERFWLPRSASWRDLLSTEKSQYPNLTWDLVPPLAIAVILVQVRKLFEKHVASPIGRSFGVRDVHIHQPPAHPLLEREFQRCLKPNRAQILEIARETGWTDKRVEWWFRNRRKRDKPSQLAKFNESCWRFTFYLSAFIGGVAVLWNKPWFYDSTSCWTNYPFDSVGRDVYVYYVVEAGFYLSLTASQFHDTRRKDFCQMFVHHVTTLSLLYFSWACNMVRVGTLVLVIHDAIDPILEAAKMAKYCRLDRLADVIFSVFAAVWFVTRLVLYPIKCVYSVMVEAPAAVGHFSGLYVFSSLLCLLQVMHVMWSYIICRLLYLLIIDDKGRKDIRSSSEESGNENDKIN